ncbi:MAG: hypothetical protein CYPHOPRED_000003 [Cyphobasidiales sp. Tagirdzhanova-0007]|nr:MAG: hypothetical protein CYPHOPRED_000003 [Cyphobasidiales sp. Tagirdzhanova-0007]
MPISNETLKKPAKTYLFGYPLKRSYSPFLHNTLYKILHVPRTYSKWETLSIEEVVAATHAEDFVGAAVTMPHKVAICKHCDDMTEEGRAIGACNTIFWRKEADGSRKLVGHNTDCIGVRDSFLLDAGPHLTKNRSRPGMIVGGGGASRSAVYAMAVYLNCSPIYVVNRDESEVEHMIADFKKSATPSFNPEMIHVKTPEQAKELPAPAYIVSAIPCFPPKTPEEIAARNTLEAILAKPEKGAILEMCYHPHIWTDICTIARDSGWRVITGEVAMIWQGIEQQKVWLDCKQEELPVKQTFDIVVKQVKADSANHTEPPDF